SSIIDGNWTLWSYWSTCSVSCGIGITTRHRACSNPSPTFGGKYCVGSNSESSNCTEASEGCPVDGRWTLWSFWTQCSVTCGTGIQTRHRACANPSPTFGGQNCKGTNHQTTSCTEPICRKRSS
ncbi:thrombospondin-2-like, partial [Mya arenaria]|uniref:thrombospondin-2-like n=1 Tax=Mya arenaria TaxID=6604 RepID=UPI0022E0095E